MNAWTSQMKPQTKCKMGFSNWNNVVLYEGLYLLMGNIHRYEQILTRLKYWLSGPVYHLEPGIKNRFSNW